MLFICYATVSKYIIELSHVQFAQSCFKIAFLLCSFGNNYSELNLNMLIFASNVWQIDLLCFVFPPLLSGCRWKRGGNHQ